ncbi:MAG: VRR-NUC domain-containing protein [Alsobacter sp.]
MPRIRRRSVSEHELQAGIVQAIRLKFRQVLVYAVPNGGSRGLVEGGRLKAEGVTPGIPDLALVLPDGRAAFLEVKTPEGQLRPEQRRFGEWAHLRGIPWAVVRNLDQALDALTSWLSDDPSRVDGPTGGGSTAPATFLEQAGATRAPV